MGWVLTCFCACANLFFSAGMHSIILHFFVFFDHFSRGPHAVLCIRARDHFSVARVRAQICFFHPTLPCGILHFFRDFPVLSAYFCFTILGI